MSSTFATPTHAAPWTANDVPDFTGKRVVVTGASSGLGLETALALAAKNAELVLAVRNVPKGEQAAERIAALYPKTELRVSPIDLADLQSIRRFADELLGDNAPIDLLINNAGVMIPPYQRTKDGFELQFGSNHLGHFALTGRLLPLLRDGARVVTLSSIAARSGKIDFDNLDGSKGYSPMKFYCQSKLANWLFARELQRRFDRADIDAVSIGCHPGISSTNLFSRGTGKETGPFYKFLLGLVGQPAAMGALPTLYAAAHPSLRGGELIGPNGRGNRKGYPAPDSSGDRLFDAAIAERLWSVSEQLTGVKYL
ncbi:oxidoreductase [Paenibacillus sp. TRM 82003]|nr:oxidoreductase [Paenibacillus sp. TRM 82003]